MTSIARVFCEFIKQRFFLISWISLVIYLFYNTFIFYFERRQFYFLRNILGLGLCVSRGTASVLNLCCALVLLPLCKKLNQILYRVLSDVWPGLFFYWLEKAKSFHMTVAITLLVFAVVHSISHFVNLWNFSRGFDEIRKEINLARYKNESPFSLLLSQAGVTGVSMLIIITCMGLTSMRAVRRRIYNAFWYTHQLYVVFLALLIVHPLSGVLKEEVLYDDEVSLNPSQPGSLWVNNSSTHKFTSIKSMTWAWMAFPLSCFFVDLIWRIFSRNRAKVAIVEVSHMPGRTMALTVRCPHDQFRCRMGQYVLLQCQDLSLLEWHPFTVVRLPTSSQRDFVIWIRVKGDWTESLENLLLKRGSNGINILVDGPFSSPMEHTSRTGVCLCVAAGVGITPFVCLLHHIYMNPRSKLPGRVHLIWIVRYEEEITWLAELANKTIMQLRNANRPDRLHLELYVTSNTNNNKLKAVDNKDQNDLEHLVLVNEKGQLSNVIHKKDTNPDDEKATLLTPNVKRHVFNDTDNVNIKIQDNDYDLAKEYPILGCRVRRGRPHWDTIFGYWVHLYPKQHLNIYCCGTKKLVKTLRRKCVNINRTTKNRFTFIHEGFS
ncbi:NADPH oxidase 4-like isoform X2 [Plodia interpunctella]|uniref:NADPH oxidase 4-like isoform X2 n=1 Tax=Plodia interpunctella TaxID=58824 RepID=UPI0023682331|nr:NADPH oxidase 4-like isoform X2 [Plodia interpunctella]